MMYYISTRPQICKKYGELHQFKRCLNTFINHPMMKSKTDPVKLYISHVQKTTEYRQ